MVLIGLLLVRKSDYTTCACECNCECQRQCQCQCQYQYQCQSQAQVSVSVWRRSGSFLSFFSFSTLVALSSGALSFRASGRRWRQRRQGEAERSKCSWSCRWRMVVLQQSCIVGLCVLVVAVFPVAAGRGGGVECAGKHRLSVQAHCGEEMVVVRVSRWV